MLASLEPLILVFHVLICVFLVVAILLQAGKGADLGAAFGAGSSQSLFGARGAATFLTKLTTVVAILFLATSLTLATLHRDRSQNNTNLEESVIPVEKKKEEVKPEEKKEEKTEEKKEESKTEENSKPEEKTPENK